MGSQIIIVSGKVVAAIDAAILAFGFAVDCDVLTVLKKYDTVWMNALSCIVPEAISDAKLWCAAPQLTDGSRNRHRMAERLTGGMTWRQIWPLEAADTTQLEAFSPIGTATNPNANMHKLER